MRLAAVVADDSEGFRARAVNPSVKVSTAKFVLGSGWTAPLPAELDGPSTWILAFGSRVFREDGGPFADLRAAFPTSHILGCSTAGEILGTTIEDGTMTVAVARFDRTLLASTSASFSPGACYEAGRRLARSLCGEGLKKVFVLGSAVGMNGTDLARGMQTVLGGVPVSGALAADGMHFQRTWVLAEGGRPRENVVSAVGFYGEAVIVGHGSRGGWDKFGPERRVTRAAGNVLYELDGRPALDLYKDYLGELAAGLPGTALFYPLAMRPDRATDEQIVRTVLAHSESDRTLSFAGDIPEGSLAQLMRANVDRLVLAAADAAEDCKRAVDKAELCVAVSCVGRRAVLGERAEEETEAVADVLPAQCPIVGLYAYGELSPMGALGCRLHNQTMTLTTFAERGV